MKIEIHLHATLQKFSSSETGNIVEVDLPDGSSIRTVLDYLTIEVAPEHLLFVLNGRTSELDQILEDGDVLHLMTAVSGG